MATQIVLITGADDRLRTYFVEANEQYHAAAVKIQAATRGWLTRCRIWAIRTQFEGMLEDESATFYDMWTMVQQRMSPEYERQQAAALTIQRVWRGYCGRRYVWWLRDQLHRTEVTELAQTVEISAAAIRIQKVWRGALIRDDILEMLIDKMDTSPWDATTTLQVQSSSTVRRELIHQHFLEYSKQLNLITTLQRVGRGYIARHTHWDTFCLVTGKAATAIQSLWRGYMVRSTYIYSFGGRRCYAHPQKVFAPAVAVLQRAWRC
eukprot:CAMPEP_0174367078 /NCGR_PEP_ID=MMETSP0811_2-20130205/83763_1 /TAXON_ID=73025 ORGANISM="Eutreptiella gymnastica-like, Strain CCMP1594" /NCGR_SAMPLE_ID=MMETSP0811_2 /ASSEMBLY_ACC=CAM_ASM_000667 /LENGTH=263 /DNA_ID=CAMNT_0015509265 /DNA_START=16 /DNA_END=804 /DNA_ORIENTATION=+